MKMRKRKATKFKRRAIKSIGTLRFRSGSYNGDVIIPRGTIVATKDGIRFKTKLNGITKNGWCEIEAECCTKGTIGNVMSYIFFQLISKVEGILDVISKGCFIGGIDKE